MEFRVGNFNLRNLTLPNFLFYENLEYSEEEYTQKCRWCSEQLTNMAADIVAFQEVFHYEPLHKICEESGLYGDNPHIICPMGVESSPRVGLVSKHPILRWILHENFPEECQTTEFQQFRRPLIEAYIDMSTATKKQIVRVFAVHMKSKRALFVDEQPHNIIGASKGIARSLRLRTQEAIALRQLINQDIDTPTVVVGDFNDTAYSVTTQIICGIRSPFDAPPEVKRIFSQARLQNVHEYMQRQALRDVHYTYYFNGQYEAVDHIFTSQHFLPPNGDIISFRSYTDHLIDRINEAQPKHTSDHGQIVALLSLQESL